MKLRWIDSTGATERDLAELPALGRAPTDSLGSTFLTGVKGPRRS